MIIVYVHGFASAFDPQNEKVIALRNAGYTVLGLEYEGSNPVKDFNALKEQLSKVVVEYIHDDIAVMGTSLGGYYARILGAIFGLKTILVNPSLHPELTMRQHIGKTVVNYLTRQPIRLTGSTIDGYETLNDQFGDVRGEMLVLLDSGDEVLCSEKTRRELQDEAHVVMFEGGNHRFQHMRESITHIERYLNNYSD